MPRRQINDPLLGKHYFLLFLPVTISSLSLEEGHFELTGRPSKAPQTSLMCCLWNFRDTRIL